MKKSFLLFVSGFLAFALAACGVAEEPSSNKVEKVAPTYKGMKIVSEQENNVASLRSFFADASDNTGKGDEHDNGWHGRKNHNGDEELPDNYDERPEIEQEIEEVVNISVETDNEIKYYVNKGEKFLLLVELNNPSKFEIQSFTLNAEKYANYMFKEGSDMEHLYLEVSAPNYPGYTSYTIDAIKYIDGTSIKDVDLSSGNQTISAGVRYDVLPNATVTNEALTTTSMSFDLFLDDRANLLANKEVKVYLSDGEAIVDSKDVVVGNNHISFNNLLIDTEYQYGVISTYDICDGNKEQIHTIMKHIFVTPNSFAFKDVEAGKEGVAFGINKTGTVGELSYLAIYDKEDENSLVESLDDLTANRFENLLSDHEYILYLESTYQVGEDTYHTYNYYDLKTVAKTAPAVSFKDIAFTQTSVSFDYETTDVDNILSIEKVELFKDGELVEEKTEPSDKEFTGLLSNTEYTLKLTYEYDLNDGEGTQKTTVSRKVSTASKTAPTVAFKDVTSTQTSVSFDYETTDVDNILSIEKVELFKDGELVEEKTEPSDKEFTGLLSNTEYTLKLTYEYDLNDGHGNQELSITKQKFTLPRDVTIQNVLVLTDDPTIGDSIRFRCVITNPDSVTIDSVIVNNNDVEVSMSSNTVITFAIDATNGGELDYAISGFNCSYGGGRFTAVLDEGYSGSVDVWDTFAINSISDETKDGIVYADVAIKEKLIIEVENPSNYVVTSVVYTRGNSDATYTVGSDHLTMVDSNHIAIDFSGYDDAIYETNLIKFTLKKISITNGVKTIEKSFPDKTYAGAYVMNEGGTPIEVSTLEEIQSMTNGYAYQLTSDINAQGYAWTPKDFKGAFIGAGHTISNLTYTLNTTANDSRNTGLFGEFSGTIVGLNMYNPYFYISAVSTVNAGFMVGHVSDYKSAAIIDSSVSNGQMDIEGALSSDQYYGGLVGKIGGYGNDPAGIITRCSVDNVAITNVSESDSSLRKIGGILGFANEFYWQSIHCEISDCSVRGLSITSSGGKDGLYGGVRAGLICPETVGIVRNVVVYDSSISGSNYSVCTVIGGNQLTLIDGVVAIDITLNSTTSSVSFSDNASLSTLGNNYSYNCPQTGSITMSISDLDSSDFYQAIGFDGIIWDYENLSYNSGVVISLR